MHLILFTLLAAMQTILLIGIQKRAWRHGSLIQWQMAIWLVSIAALFFGNAYYFPLSIWSKLLDLPILFSLGVFSMAMAVLCLLTLNALLTNRYSLATLLTLALVLQALPGEKESHHNRSSKPDVIILGIDSLSPESVNTMSMPFFHSLINKNIQFTQSISPLARTYPAWSTILTGLYAKNHLAQENLFPDSIVKSEKSIAWTLKNEGYNTIYATDDRRFNGVGADFGFKTVIGPKFGGNDIILGSFNDFPLSNLLSNHPVGAWLFPYNYMNRASFFSYYPSTFTKHLEKELAQQTNSDPLFLAIHFTLPHWPYAWAESSADELNNEFSLEKRDTLYQSSLRRVDAEFHDFYHYLQKNKYFENSLLIILSDHGEVLFYPGSRLTNKSNYRGQAPSRFAEYLEKNTATVLDKSAGHGSDILSPAQYHNVLNLTVFTKGKEITKRAKITTRVSLLDIAPTILDFLEIKEKRTMDGISLLPTVLSPSTPIPPRAFMIESGMCPNLSFSREKAAALGKQYYQINPLNNHLEILKNQIDAINAQKLYGILDGNWVLTLYPEKENYIPVIQNLETGQWTDDPQSSYWQSTPAVKLLQQLKNFYGTQLQLSNINQLSASTSYSR